MFFLIFGQFGSFYGHFTVILWSFWAQSVQFTHFRFFPRNLKFLDFLDDKISNCCVFLIWGHLGSFGVIWGHFTVILRSFYGRFVVSLWSVWAQLVQFTHFRGFFSKFEIFTDFLDYEISN